MDAEEYIQIDENWEETPRREGLKIVEDSTKELNIGLKHWIFPIYHFKKYFVSNQSWSQQGFQLESSLEESSGKCQRTLQGWIFCEKQWNLSQWQQTNSSPKVMSNWYNRQNNICFSLEFSKKFWIIHQN